MSAPSENPPSRRRGRPPKGARQLSTGDIVQATLQLIDREGVDAVSLRAVARTLGVDAKSLYNHVDGKDGLLDVVAEHLLASIAIPTVTGDPFTDLRSIAHAFRNNALEHPSAAPLVLTRQMTSVRGLAPVDAILGILRNVGLPPDEAVHTLRFLVATVIGTLLREVHAGPTFGTTDEQLLTERTAEFSASGLPHVTEASENLATFHAEKEFNRTLDIAFAAVLPNLSTHNTDADGRCPDDPEAGPRS